jgi:hypothetical protein
MGVTGDWGYHLEKFEDSPGFFYVDKGTLNLYNTMWKTIVYVDLQTEELEIDNLGSYIRHVDRLCNSVEVKNWTGCSQFRESVLDRFRHLQRSDSLLTETVETKYEEARLRRGVLNFVGEISKVLFGTLDENDADYYDEQIRNFERNSEDMTDLYPTFRLTWIRCLQRPHVSLIFLRPGVW